MQFIPRTLFIAEKRKVLFAGSSATFACSAMKSLTWKKDSTTEFHGSTRNFLRFFRVVPWGSVVNKGVLRDLRGELFIPRKGETPCVRKKQ